MTTRKSLATSLTNFKDNNTFTDEQIAEMLDVTTEQVNNLLRGNVRWLALSLMRRIINLTGE